MINGSELLHRLLATFQGEAEDHLRAFAELLAQMGKEADRGAQQRIVETLFRRMHTLKGAAHAVNLLEVAESCQGVEHLLADLKAGQELVPSGVLETLHRELALLERTIFPVQTAGKGTEGEGTSEPVEEGSPPQAEPVSAGEPAAERVPPAPSPTPPAGGTLPRVRIDQARGTPLSEARHHATETVRVPVALLEQLLLKAEELVSAKLTLSDLVQGISELAAELSLGSEERARGVVRAQKSVRVGGDKLAALSAQVVQQTEREGELIQRLDHLAQRGQRGVWALGGMVDGLLEEMRELQLLPVSSLLGSFHRLVRELGEELGKEAELEFSGGELEVDRRILAELKEPLLHLMRNIVDHGIELPAERERKGKPRRGRVQVAVKHLDGNRAEITVSDDGGGIDPAKVKGAALRLGLLTIEQAAKLADADCVQLVFESGLSTSALITGISGRGLGLAIVREGLEKLGGHATVASTPGAGTHFRLVLPLSFARIGALLVEVSGRAALLPAGNVEGTVRVPAADILCVENRETVTVGGCVLPLVRLARVLGLSEPQEQRPSLGVVVLHALERRIAFAVDAVCGVQEVLVKPLGPQLARVRNVAAATVLGNGKVVPILNVNDLVRSALSAPQAAVQTAMHPTHRPLSVLVAEDSITSRTLLKNVLEGAGFSVRTAVDGVDALTVVKSEEIDLVVSDVEMPRMDGFQLTAAIRGEKRLAELPVILVTGLESRSDRERGIEVGANAYIVKSSFDQGGLVEVIRKLAGKG